MKVGFFNKKLWRDMTLVISIVAAVETIALGVCTQCPCAGSTIGILCFAAFVCIYIVKLILVNRMKSRELTIRKTKLKIKFGDIFEEKGRKVINFNEYFDTQVDDKIVAKNTLNGIVERRIGKLYLNQIKDSKEVENVPFSLLDEKIKTKIYKQVTLSDDEILQVGQCVVDFCIKNDTRILDRLRKTGCSRLHGGKTDAFELGTICPFLDYGPENEFFLLAFSKFDKDDKAFHTVTSFVSCLMFMWEELDALYAQKPIALTLLGGGITRFKGADLSNQELLKLIVWTFKQSQVDFVEPASLTIVLGAGTEADFNLYEIE